MNRLRNGYKPLHGIHKLMCAMWYLTAIACKVEEYHPCFSFHYFGNATPQQQSNWNASDSVKKQKQIYALE